MDCVKHLRRWWFGLVWLIVTGVVLTPYSQAESCDSVIINGSDVWKPVSYRQEGLLVGIVPDILIRTLAQMGHAVDVAPPQPWKRLLESVAKGKIDVVSGAYGNAQRAKTYLYSDVIFQDEVRVFVRKGREFPFQSLDDLVGKAGAIPRGASYGEAFDAFAKEHLLLFEPGSYSAMFQMLNRGRIDFIVLAYFDGLAEVQRSELSDVISILPQPVVINDVYALFSKTSPCSAVLPEFNRRLKVLKKSGEWQRIIETHIRSAIIESP